MSQKIIFEGNHCKVVEETILSECTSEQMMALYQKQLPIQTKFMPRGTFYYERLSNGSAVYVVEHTPRIAKIKWKQVKGSPDDTAEQYRVAVPFVYWCFSARESSSSNNLRHVYVCCTTKPVRKPDDPIFVLPFPNIHGKGSDKMCLGAIKYNIQDPIRDQIETTMDGIFSLPWNPDLSFDFPENARSFKEWSEKTIENGLFWNEIKYRPHAKKTFGELMKHMLTEQ
jgi:hypothetical protein